MAVLSPIERAEAELQALESAFTAAEPQQPSPQPQAQEPESTQQSAPQPQADEYYQKWKSLDGMLRKKDEQIAQMSEQYGSLLNQFNALAQQIAQSPQPAPQPPADQISELSAAYGGDTVEAIQKVLDAMYANKLAGVDAQAEELAQIKSSVASLAKETDRSKSERFQSELGVKVSDWRTIIASQEWNMWLDSNHDDITGQSYRSIFDVANDEWAMSPMVALMNKFKTTSVQPQPQVDPRAHLAVPSGGIGTGAPSSAQPKVWRSSEVESAYEMRRRGAYTDEQWLAIDQDIMMANMEGRIVAG